MTSTDATDSRDAGHNPSAGGGGHFVRWAILGFVVACVGLFVLATQIETETAAPGFPLTPVAVPAADGTFRLTLDTANRNAWVGVDLGGGRAVAGQAPADLRLRRYLLQAPGGVVDLGPISLSEATPPSADAEWVMDVDVDGASQSPTLSRWYEYGYSSHLLTSKDHTYAVRRADGSIALVEVVSYYCDPEGSGCLTLRYRLVD